jgi:hypothetical protein
MFFNLRGKELATLKMKGRLVRLIPIRTRLAETFLVITKATNKVKIINGADFRVYKVLDQRPYPELVAAIDDTRRLLMVEEIKKTPAVVENRVAVVWF